MDEERRKRAIATIVIGSGFLLLKGTQNVRRKRNIWAKAWLSPSRGAYNTILKELRLSNQNDFKKYLRMNEETFEELLQRVRPYLTKQTTRLRKPIPAEQKLAITLCYMATGEDSESLMFHFRVHSTTISQSVPYVSYIIYKTLENDYMCLPSSEDEWLQLCENTFSRWNFPNVWGAIDGKHI